jgi:hypothetical protein
VTNEPTEPDLKHLEWLVDRRSDIQHTLLALYNYVRGFHFGHPILIDHLVAAAFSLWRAVFLAGTSRDWVPVSTGQKKFLLDIIYKMQSYGFLPPTPFRLPKHQFHPSVSTTYFSIPAHAPL